MRGLYSHFFQATRGPRFYFRMESCILQQSEVRVKCKTHILPAPKCEARVLSVSIYEARVFKSKHDGRVLAPCKVRVSTKQRETHVQHCMFSRQNAKKPSPPGFEASSSDVPSTDLRDYLIRKRSVHQIAPRCHCEQLISTVLSDCHCGFQTN